MAQPATIYQMTINLSDVDRGVYEVLELRLARHPSETVRYMLTRVLAYALSYEEGIAFSKGGLSNHEDPPISVTDRTGIMTTWIDIGMPSADRLHKASKAVRNVVLFTSGDVALIRKDAASRPIHRAEHLVIQCLEARFLDAIEEQVGRSTNIELVHTDGQLYATIGGVAIEGRVTRASLVE